MILPNVSQLFFLQFFIFLVVENSQFAEGWSLVTENYNGDSDSVPGGESVNGALAIVKFLSRPRNRRDLSQNDYHILEIDVPSKKQNFKVHLVKGNAAVSPSLQTFVVNENGTRNLMSDNSNSLNDCMYTGKISGNKDGHVALSTFNTDRPGFVGMISTGDEHLFIEPKIVNSNESRNSSESTHVTDIIHVIHDAKDVVPPSTFSDAIVVPSKDLDEAKAEMAAKYKNLKNNSKSDGEENSVVQTMDVNGYEENAIHIESLAAKKIAKSSKSSRQIVDLAVFTDAKMYRNFKKKFPNDSVKQMKLFILTLVNCMQIIYKHKSIEMDVHLNLVVVEILQSDPHDLGQSEDGEKYLNKFCKFSKSKNTDGESWDHALMLTGYDIHAGGNPSVAGLAYAGTMCLPRYSCSVSESKALGGVFTISHELGHSLGMEHDGTGSSKSCNKEKYIMSPTTGSGKTTWSTCSATNLKDFIATGNSDPKKRRSSDAIPACLSKASKNRKSINYSSKKLPGEIYDSKAQCEMDRGAGYFAYITGKYSDPCYMLYCAYYKTSTMMGVISAHPALEGTTCAKGKKCRGGKCA